jgi:23S rRNA (pseudouridine1915-N3)-methyltransferase
MRCQVVVVGSHQKMPSWCRDACEEYAKRLSRFLKYSFIEIPTEPHAKKEDEGRKILQKIPNHHYVIALDEHGDPWTTMDLSKKMSNWQQQSQDLSFIIGGANGLSKGCLERANTKWSLSALTFPHALVRVLLLEQFYRAMSILANHPYHRE